MGSIDPVNPVYTYNLEQIHAVDWDRRRRFQSTPICSSMGRRGRGPAHARQGERPTRRAPVRARAVLTVIATFPAMGAAMGAAAGFEGADLERLRHTGVCPACDLRGAELS